MKIKYELEYNWWLESQEGKKRPLELSASTKNRLSEIALRGIADRMKDGYVEGDMSSPQREGVCRGYWKLKRIYDQ